MRFLFERLNSPIAVLVILAFFLIVDGFLLYRYQQSLQTTGGDVGSPLVREGTSFLEVGPTTAKTTPAQERESTTAKETTASGAVNEASEVQVAIRVVGATTAGLRVYANRQIVFDQAVVQPGFSRVFEAEEEITIWAYNAQVVHVEVGGRNIGPLGGPGQFVVRTFTAET